jgi:hypothetical protein
VADPLFATSVPSIDIMLKSNIWICLAVVDCNFTTLARDEHSVTGGVGEPDGGALNVGDFG